MATEGKKPATKVKTAFWSCIGFLVAWVATKTLDTYLDKTVLNHALGLISQAWQWLQLDSAVPNWSLPACGALLASTLGVAIYYHREASKAYSELNDAEQVALASKSPSQPPLSETQAKIMWCFAHFANTGESFEGGSLASYTKLERLEIETGIDQLIAMGMVQWVVHNSFTGGRTPRLTIKGKECALAIYKSAQPLNMSPSSLKPSISDLKN